MNSSNKNIFVILIIVTTIATITRVSIVIIVIRIIAEKLSAIIVMSRDRTSPSMCYGTHGIAATQRAMADLPIGQGTPRRQRLKPQRTSLRHLELPLRLIHT